MKKRAKIFLVSAALVAVPLAAFALRVSTTPPNPIFDCPQATDEKSLDACSEGNLARLEAKNAKPPHYDKADGVYYYQQLATLPEGYGKKETYAQALLRHRLGEWLYFSTPAFIADDGKPPVDYTNICASCMGGPEYYRLKDGRVMLIFWNYMAPAQSHNPAFTLAADGTLTPMRQEVMVEAPDTLKLVDAGFNELSFDPKTGELHESSKGGGGTWYTSEYILEGDIFRLQKETRLDPDPVTDEMAAIETVIYERKKK